MGDLDKRQLGRTGVEVTTLGYGALELQGRRTLGGPPADRGQAELILNTVLDAGINIIDTAPDYGPSEELIGELIAHRRQEYFLATKCGCVGTTWLKWGHVWTRENILQNVEDSLRKLKTDYFDLLQLHDARTNDVEGQGLLDVLREIQRSGKTRFIGISATAATLQHCIATGGFDAFQIPYSPVERGHEAVIGQAAEAGIGTIIRGKMALAAQGPHWDRAGFNDLLDGATKMEFVLRYTVSHPGLTTVIVGTTDPEHLADNIAAVQKGPLPDDVYREAKLRLASTDSRADLTR